MELELDFGGQWGEEGKKWRGMEKEKVWLKRKNGKNDIWQCKWNKRPRLDCSLFISMNMV